ncbi:MAG: S9 family peptidase [Bacteroidales bacterium]
MNKHRYLWLVIVVLMVTPQLLLGQKSKITLEDIFKRGTFRAKSVYGLTPMNNGDYYSAYNVKRQVAKFKYATGDEVEVLFSPEEYPNEDLKEFAGYKLSPAEDKMLIETHYEPIYRHSYTSINYIFDIKAKTLTPLSKNGPQKNATFSPDGKWIAFVRDNNIFLVNPTTLEEIKITTDGLYNYIINGAADWVYEEEFSLTTGLQWSPDSKKLAFYRFDESSVKMFNMTKYEGNLYPENYTFKYPKAGETNSTVSIHVYDLNSRTTSKMDIGAETDQYIARIKWTADPNQLCMVRLNRLQNTVDILTANATNGTSSILYTETNKYYIEEVDDNYPTFTPDGKNFVITSEQNGYKHIYFYGMDGKLNRQLTSGANEVTDVYGYDASKKTVFYQAIDDSPLRKAIYSVSVNGGTPTKFSLQSGNNFANFSSEFKYCVLYNTSANSPLTVTLLNSKGKAVRTIEDNAKLKERLADYEMPSKEFFTFKTSEGVELNGYMIKPFDFDPTKRYPVLMYQYSGPGSQSVLDNFSVGWDEYLATLNYIVVCVDGRGTGGRGEAFKKMTYGQLGYYESTDQVEAAKYLQTLPYIDANRIGIWGWSYGGYMSSLCLFKGADVFRMAIAVAPVTNWRYYDSIYTERFMGLPRDNGLGYDNNSPINHVDKLKGNFLLVHGTADDNVHVQNSMELAEKLVQSGKQFDLMIYPDKNHGIRGGNTPMHLYTLLTKYVKENL